MLGLGSVWEVNSVCLSDYGSTRGKNWEWVWCRIQPKGCKSLPAALILLPPPAPPKFQVAQTAIPMSIDPAMLARLDDAHSNTGQVKGGNGQDQDEAFQSFGRGEFTGMDLVSARFFIQKAFLNVEAQTVLAQRLVLKSTLAGRSDSLQQVDTDL